jgi:hypothetical protein
MEKPTNQPIEDANAIVNGKTVKHNLAEQFMGIETSGPFGATGRAEDGSGAGHTALLFSRPNRRGCAPLKAVLGVLFALPGGLKSHSAWERHLEKAVTGSH